MGKAIPELKNSGGVSSSVVQIIIKICFKLYDKLWAMEA